MRAKADNARFTAGFTLLEVLAAVAILGIWFTVLAGVAVQGLRAEGQNSRIIRASLAADAALVDVEAAITAGAFPIEDQEFENDEFQIVVRRIPFSDAGFESSEYDLAALVTENLTTVAGDLYEIAVEVSWIEGVDEKVLVRTTYAWDSTAYLEAIGGLENPSGEDGESAQGAGNAGEDDA